jgi:hypothetical protein
MSNIKYILFSTPTSATGSLWRILTELNPKNTKLCSVIDYYLNNGIKFEDIQNEILPDNFDLYLFNQPQLFNFEQDLSQFKFIVNFRDPRDLVCNQFHWIFVHPVPAEQEAFIQKYRAQLKADGIANYCINNDVSFFYNNFFTLFEKIPAEDICTISYAQMCLMSNQVIEKVAQFIQSPLTDLDIASFKEKEFPSELHKNTNWIAGRWTGADLLPGRARIELDYKTFSLLTERYQPILNFMQQKDVAGLSVLYT